MNMSRGGFFDNLSNFFGNEESSDDGSKPDKKQFTLRDDRNDENEIDYITKEIQEDYPGSSLVFRIQGNILSL